MEYLQGGRENKIGRVDNAVHRPAGPWTRSVHALLRHVRAVGFTAVPEPLGFDDAGKEIVTFLEGEVSNYPLSAAAASEEALVSAARLLRAYHEATRAFLAQNPESHTWLLPSRTPIEVICHGDFAPYNLVLNGRQAVGIIDFDTAHPGPRIWDIAYALYRWAPFTNQQNPDRLGNLETQIDRARLFCDAYGFPAAQRDELSQLRRELDQVRLVLRPREELQERLVPGGGPRGGRPRRIRARGSAPLLRRARRPWGRRRLRASTASRQAQRGDQQCRRT